MYTLIFFFFIEIIDKLIIKGSYEEKDKNIKKKLNLFFKNLLKNFCNLMKSCGAKKEM